MTSTSRSVAFRESLVSFELRSTLARMGIVLRRSTTRCTWDSDLSRSARSTVIFMRNPAHLCSAIRARKRCTARAETSTSGKTSSPGKILNHSESVNTGTPETFAGVTELSQMSLLQLAFQDLDFRGETVIRPNQRLDLANRMQNCGVV